MKSNDLEETKDLFDIVDVPSPIETIEMEGVNKVNVSPEEVNTPSKEEQITRESKNKDKKNKKSLREKWRNISSKKKVTIIVTVIIVIA